MQKIFINYANQDFTVQQVRNTESALNIGKVDRVISYTPDDIDIDFYRKHKKILNKTRGAGYWLWKPYIIRKTLLRDDIQNGDVIFYADSGTMVLKDLTPVFRMPEHYNQDVVMFDMGENCNTRCKRDTFILMGCDTPEAHNAPMIAGNFNIWRKSDYSIQFIEKCLYYATQYDIISDSRSKLGEELPNFEMHRHDQPVFGLVALMEGVPLVKSDIMYGYEQQGVPPDTFLKSARVANRNKWRRLRYKLAMIPEKIWRHGGIWGYFTRQFTSNKLQK